MTSAIQTTDPRERLAHALASVGTVEKDRTNRHEGYDYQSEAAIKLAAQRALGAHGLAPDKVAFEILSDEWRMSTKTGIEYNMVKVRCTVVVAGSPAEGLGCGRDYGDKALMKAQTSAVREAWKNLFVIPSIGGDPEEDSFDDSQAHGPRRDTPPPPRREPTPRAQPPRPTPAKIASAEDVAALNRGYDDLQRLAASRQTNAAPDGDGLGRTDAAGNREFTRPGGPRSAKFREPRAQQAPAPEPRVVRDEQPPPPDDEDAPPDVDGGPATWVEGDKRQLEAKPAPKPNAPTPAQFQEIAQLVKVLLVSVPKERQADTKVAMCRRLAGCEPAELTATTASHFAAGLKAEVARAMQARK